MKHKDIIEALQTKYNSDVLFGKGGFWVKGEGFISLAKARKITGIKGTERKPQEMRPCYGDYATLVQMNRIRK